MSNKIKLKSVGAPLKMGRPSFELGGTPLSNFDIENNMKGVKGFMGCFSMDTLPNKKMKTGDCFVVNMEPSTMGGSHWICCYHDKDACYYLDSFGLPPHETLELWIKAHCVKPMLYQNNELQHPDSKRCGLYCLYFLKELSKGTPIYSILYKLDQHPSEFNEKFIDLYFRKK